MCVATYLPIVSNWYMLQAFVCETRGFWDILPPKVAHLSLKDEVIELYVTEDVDVDMGNPQSAKNDFDFMKGR